MSIKNKNLKNKAKPDLKKRPKGSQGLPDGSVVKNPPVIQETQVWFLGGERSGHTRPFSCLGNPMDRGAWRATVHMVAKEADTPEWLSLHLGGDTGVTGPPAPGLWAQCSWPLAMGPGAPGPRVCHQRGANSTEPPDLMFCDLCVTVVPKAFTPGR